MLYEVITPALLARPLHERFGLVVVGAPHQDTVDLDRRQAGGAGRGEPAQDSYNFV